MLSYRLEKEEEEMLMICCSLCEAHLPGPSYDRKDRERLAREKGFDPERFCSKECAILYEKVEKRKKTAKKRDSP